MILHADVDAFFASVAQRDDPRLRGLPTVVGSWVVMAASYEARAFGIRGGMPTAKAKRLCPRLRIADHSWEAYSEASRAVFAIFDRHVDLVQPGSLEEAFLHVPDATAQEGARLGALLRRDVREEVGLPLSVGVAGTKVLAKIASRSAKPDGLYVVAPGDELGFLHPLPVERIWGVGPATAGRLNAHGIRTVGEAATHSEPELMVMLGKAAGRYVHAVAHNREPRPVQRRRGRRSFGAQRSLGRRPRTREDLDGALDDLSERLCRRMQAKARAGRTVVLRLRFGDYTKAARSRTLRWATDDALAIAGAARELLDAAAPLIERRGITLIGLAVTNLDVAVGAEQLLLFADEPGVMADRDDVNGPSVQSRGSAPVQAPGSSA
jgi:DNA polymerase-4